MTPTMRFEAPPDTARTKNIILKKSSIRYFYQQSYQRYKRWLNMTVKDGQAIELGSGVGFVKEYIPELITTDVVSYPGLDQILDATDMPYDNESLRFICMLNVFHHISDVEKFLDEAQRCLKSKGKIHIIDQHAGFFGRFVFKYLHHENFDPNALDWSFCSLDPVSDANGALAWIVFQRDQDIFKKKFPSLEIIEYRPHTPLYYWLSGGLKDWSLLNKNMIRVASKIDGCISKNSLGANCLVDIVLEKQ